MQKDDLAIFIKESSLFLLKLNMVIFPEKYSGRKVPENMFRER